MKFQTLSSRAVRLPRTNIDTDQIIPARFLKVTGKKGIGRHLFADWRSGGDFVLNSAESATAQILIAGDNFGCGSSREHAVWALMDFGFRSVISTRFGDIFRQNALKNGLLPITLDSETHEKLLALPVEGLMTIDLTAQTLTCDGFPATRFHIDAFSKMCLVEDLDELGYILKHQEAIANYERARNNF